MALKRSENFPIIYPGEMLGDELAYREITISKAAEMLGISRVSLSNIVHGKSAITANVALRIATVFGGTADIWVRLQADYDLRVAEKEFKKNPPKLQSVA
ncbi:MAG: HigA family addiction module antitoxin [Chitinophagaceae bacterium]